ncbi:MAG: phosphatidylglycerol lysyltransferase domain-containing protein [Selenomonadaceae bacterium]|nr:phosphatidylglycerol lysyltransferase domain-containing protein [Selenomonadaceae bacterium]
MSIIEFHGLTKADKPLLDRYFQSRYYENSHFTFTNLYMWREPYQVKWCEEDGVLYMTCQWDGQLMAWQPYGPEEKMKEATEKFLAYFEQQGQPFVMTGIEKSYVQVLENYTGASFAIEADRDNFDYVYLAEKLISLSGRKLHSKKNHLNAFRKLYPQAEYLPITEEILSDCLEELQRWYDIRIKDEPDDPFIGWESRAIREVFEDYAYFGLKGGAIRLDGRIIAFTFGEQLNTDSVVVHVEKADPNIRGAYPAINQAYVKNCWQGMTYINREEDMGHEGLRKAKESYKPVKMIEKFNIKRLA